MNKSPLKWTNQSLRAHLGERGFIQGESILQNNVYYTEYSRVDDSVTLAEYGEGPEPELFYNGDKIDPMIIGYRNAQIQHDKLRGD